MELAPQTVETPEEANRVAGLRRVGEPLPVRPGGESLRESDREELRRLRGELPASFVTEMERTAAANGTSLSRELIASNLVPASRVVAAAAEDIGVSTAIVPLEPSRLVLDERVSGECLKRSVPVLYRQPSGELMMLVAPQNYSRARMQSYLRKYPSVSRRLLFTTPQALRKALHKRLGSQIADRASGRLAVDQPAMSARHGMNGWQGAFVACLAMGIPLGLLVNAPATLALLHIVFTLFFMSCVLLRIRAGRAGRPVRPLLPGTPDGSELPIYSVLVACYREAAMAPQILAAMGALEWPRSKLEVKLVCEADDLETIHAFEREGLPAHFEILRVPVRGPRTKPKALNHALSCVSGEYIAIYDAEDRPHPRQLLEAYYRFLQGPLDLACVQAPLVITNASKGWLPRMFAFEYNALFDGLLPYLASRQLLLPLGGTSNHFRAGALREAGDWDPYNVTEDADLAVRLRRHGYRTGVITLPTLEEAPENLKDWLTQRTRWFKGWMQTWLVHMRSPAKLYGDLGPVDWRLTQVLFAGHVGCSLVYPLMIAVMAVTLADYFFFRQPTAFAKALALIDFLNVVMGYAAFMRLAGRRWRFQGARDRIVFALTVPVYWLLLSAAAWRACWQLYAAPFHWEKTPHKPVVET